MGHEGVGIVEGLHSNVVSKGFQLEDRVGALYFNGCCYNCHGCLHHQTHCEERKWRLMGYTNDGFFAEYAVVDVENLIPLPKTVDMRSFAPVFCAGITVRCHAVID